jgi:homoserine O-acetyltransferase
MVSYRSDVSFLQKFGRDFQDTSNETFDLQNLFKVENYLNYQGQKLINRFDPNSYIILSRALDLHDVTRDRGPVEEVMAQVKAKALCIGINSDILYPSWEQKQIAGLLSDAFYKEIDSFAGHDAFLIEFEQMEAFIKPFLEALD